MTWFFKTAGFCVMVLMLGFILEVLGQMRTMYSCKRSCKDEPDDHRCGRRNVTATESSSGQAHAQYRWYRNECERKCVRKGTYGRVDMELCTKNGQNHTTYKCSDKMGYPGLYQQCLRNESMRNESSR